MARRGRRPGPPRGAARPGWTAIRPGWTDWATPLLCALAVLWAAWPALEQPRLDADDYRYLHLVQQGSAQGLTSLADGVVENRWDHLWFVAETGRVRFFRPTVVVSYALDAWLWGERVAFGLTLGNVLVHLACTGLVAFLLRRWLGPGLPAAATAVLFAGLSSHGECLWYVAGRTDTLAALGLLAALALHVAGRERPALRGWALPCFALGLLTKELAVALPLLVVLHDGLVERRAASWVALVRAEWRLYAAYAATTLGVLGLKQLALGGDTGELVAPYLRSPLDPGFPQHLWLQARSYAGNLLFAEISIPFSGAAEVDALNHGLGLPLAAALAIGAAVLFRRDGRLWLLFALGLASWLPTCFVYISERYLYLPSVAYVGVLGLLAARPPPRWSRAAAAALLVYAAFHTHMLHRKHAAIAGQPGAVRELETQLAPVRETLAGAERLLLVNLPGDLLRAQFARDVFRVLLDAPELDVQVLTLMPGQDLRRPRRPGELPAMGAGLRVRATGPRRIRVEGGRFAVGAQAPTLQAVQEHGSVPFAWASLESGEPHAVPGLRARVVAGRAEAASVVEFTLDEPLERYRILVWDMSGTDWREHPWRRRARARVRVVAVSPP